MIKINLLPKEPTFIQRMAARVNPRKIILTLPIISIMIVIVCLPIMAMNADRARSFELYDIECYSNGVEIYSGVGRETVMFDGSLEFIDNETNQEREISADCMVTKR